MNAQHKRSDCQILSVIALFLILLQAVPALAQTLPAANTTAPAPPAEMATAPQPDTTGPEFISITAMSAKPTTMIVAWTTDEPAYGWVEYGLTDAYGAKTAKTIIANMEQAQTIMNVAAGTAYHYRVAAIDEAGNISYSADKTITTASEPKPTDNQPPEITEIAISQTTASGATVAITTDEPAQMRIEYGVTENYGHTKTAGEEFSENSTITLFGLAADTTYYYRVHATDIAGNSNISFTNEFATLPEKEPTPADPLAIIDPVASDITATKVTITWQTNRAADAAVQYGARATDASAVGPAGQTSHTVTLTGLSPATNYSYAVTSKTVDHQTVTVNDLEFTTLADEQPTIPEIRITDITTSLDSKSAVIAWKTSVITNGIIEYGPTSAYGSATAPMTPGTTHNRTLNNPLPATGYHFRIVVSDESGNSAITKDYSIKTTSVSTPTATEPAVSEPADTATEIDTPIAENQEPTDTVIVPTPQELIPPPAPSQSGGGPRTTPLKPLALIHAEALDGQAIFIIDRPATHNDARIRIVRNGHWTPKNSRDGTIIYQGPLTSFTDTKLVNGHTYHYAIYGIDRYRGVSAPILIKITPQAGKTQAFLQATPAALQRAPHYALANDSAVGATGRDVRHIQLLLAQNPAVYPEQLITGYFGELTQKAIARFQLKHGLPRTGTADATTRQKLQELSKTRQIVQKSSFYRDLTIGSEGADVLSLQIFLAAQGYYPRALLTGYFGPLTKQALIRFQSATHIKPVSGYFDAATRTRVEQITTQKETRY